MVVKALVLRVFPAILAALAAFGASVARADMALLDTAITAYQAHLQAPGQDKPFRDALLKAAVAVDALPDEPKAHLLLGMVFLRQTDNRMALESAEHAFLNVLELAPGNVKARLFLGQSYFLQRRFYSAREAWLGLLDEAPPELAPTLVAQLLRCYVMTGDVSAGIGEVGALRKGDPGNPWLAALYTGLVSAELHAKGGFGLGLQLDEMRNWWAAAKAPADLTAFVRKTWLRGE